MSEWWSIEVFDAERLAARRWKDAYQVVFEVLFESDQQWEAFRALPVIRSALDSVPDPVNGLLIYRGRGGGAGPRKPRRPRPSPAASAMSRPEPVPERAVRLVEVAPPGPQLGAECTVP
ncbi:MAG: hypothetical protein ABSA53_21835 [Streptosporangiaceae bacterium]